MATPRVLQSIRDFPKPWPDLSPQVRSLFLAMAFLGMANGIFDTAFNNYVADTFHLNAEARGALEFPRELPGFLTVGFVALLVFAPETMMAAIAALAIGLGLLGVALFHDQWIPMLFFMTLWSIGAHLIMPVRSSLTMALADSGRKGQRLGQVHAWGTFGGILGCLAVWGFMKSLPGRYDAIFWIGGGAGLVAAVVFFFMKVPGLHLSRPRWVWNRKYHLFYVLQLLFGARKQIFITFGPWVLVKVFHQPVWIFAQLWIAAAVLGLFLQPALGRLIDRKGERFVLVMDGILTFAVCMGYAFAHRLPSQTTALVLLYGCLMADQLLFGTGMARDTWLSKIAVKPEDVSPTLSMGVTINHLVSMVIAVAGGSLWMAWGHTSVFLAAGAVAVLMTVFSMGIRVSRSSAP